MLCGTAWDHHVPNCLLKLYGLATLSRSFRATLWLCSYRSDEAKQYVIRNWVYLLRGPSMVLSRSLSNQCTLFQNPLTISVKASRMIVRNCGLGTRHSA